LDWVSALFVARALAHPFAVSILRGAPGGGAIASFLPAVLRKARESTRRKADPGTRTVFVGMSPIQRSTAALVARGMHLNVHFCQTLEEGQEWLVREDDKRRKG
jgi:hypothetical protein